MTICIPNGVLEGTQRVSLVYRALAAQDSCDGTAEREKERERERDER